MLQIINKTINLKWQYPNDPQSEKETSKTFINDNYELELKNSLQVPWTREILGSPICNQDSYMGN